MLTVNPITHPSERRAGRCQSCGQPWEPDAVDHYELAVCTPHSNVTHVTRLCGTCLNALVETIRTTVSPDA